MPIDTQRHSNGGSVEPAAEAAAAGSSQSGGKRTTLAQVAARAGVSVSTASLAFSGSGPVSEATRQRVLIAAERLDYAGPDPRGRSLRQGRSGIIGVIMEERVLAAFRDPMRIAVLDGIAQDTTAQGRGLLLLSDVGVSADDAGTATMDAAMLFGLQHPRRPVDRCAASTRHSRWSQSAVRIPGVLTDRPRRRAGQRDVARHLADLGHRDVAIVALPLDGVVDRNIQRIRSRRSDGPWTRGTPSRAGHRAGHARPPPRRPLRLPGQRGVVAAGSFVDEGMIAGHALLDDPDRPADRGHRAERPARRRRHQGGRRTRPVSAGDLSRDRVRRHRAGPDHPAGPDHDGAAGRRRGPRGRTGGAGPARRRRRDPVSVRAPSTAARRPPPPRPSRGLLIMQ